MFYLAMSLSHTHGWGVCGRNLGRELSRLTDVRFLGAWAEIAHTFEGVWYSNMYATDKDRAETHKWPVVQAVQHDLTPVKHTYDSALNIGLVFSDRNIPENNRIAAQKFLDIVVAGCDWCRDLLIANGVKSAVTIHQGIDPLLFNVGYSDKLFLKDKFVVFSGGKFEFRKGQDVVIRAYKALQDRYKDVMLVVAWHNPWPATMVGMKDSLHINFDPNITDEASCIRNTLTSNGIDLKRVMILPAMYNALMNSVYQNTDIGIFPSRCEAGTNLVLMEYMACGKPAIATFGTGHKDIINEKNALLLKDLGECRLVLDGKEDVAWDEPSIDEAVYRLEWAYHNRKKIALIGRRAAKTMKTMTWKVMAEKIYKLWSKE